jgi:hypothetical protein
VAEGRLAELPDFLCYFKVRLNMKIIIPNKNLGATRSSLSKAAGFSGDRHLSTHIDL